MQIPTGIRRSFSCGVSSEMLALHARSDAVCWEAFDIKLDLISLSRFFLPYVQDWEGEICWWSESVLPRQQSSAKAEIQSVKSSMCITWPLISLPDR